MDQLNLLKAAANNSITIASSGISDSVDGITSISKAISEYGLLEVFAAVFCVAIFVLIGYVVWSNRKMMNNITDAIKQNNNIDHDIVSKIIESVLDKEHNKEQSEMKEMVDEFKKSLKPIEDVVKNINTITNEKVYKDYHKDLVGAYIDVNMALKDASREALQLLQCSRIGIYVFHNGNASLHGLPFFKMSCIHEWNNIGGNTLRGKSHMDMPLHLFNDFIEDLWKKGYYKSENVEKSAQQDPSIEEFVSFSDTKSLFMMSVKNKNNSLSGFVVAEFADIDTFEHDENRSKQIENVMSNMIQKISPIISSKYIYKND